MMRQKRSWSGKGVEWVSGVSLWLSLYCSEVTKTFLTKYRDPLGLKQDQITNIQVNICDIMWCHMMSCDVLWCHDYSLRRVVWSLWWNLLTLAISTVLMWLSSWANWNKTWAHSHTLLFHTTHTTEHTHSCTYSCALTHVHTHSYSITVGALWFV